MGIAIGQKRHHKKGGTVMENPVASRKRLPLLLVTGLFWFALYIYIPYQTPYLTAMGLAASTVGIIVGVYGFSQMIIRIPLGLFADRKSHHKPFISIGVLLAGIASLLRYLWPSGTAFLIANLISGMAASTWISFTVLFPTYYGPDGLKKATGTILMVNNCGTLIGFAVGTVVSQAAGVDVLFLLSAGAALLGFLISFFVQESPAPPREHVPSIRELLGVLRFRSLWIFALAAALIQAANMSTAMSFTTEYARELGASNIQIGLCSVLYIVAGVLGSYFTGTETAQKWGDKLLFSFFFGCFIAYLILVPLSGAVWMLYILQFIGGLGFTSLLSLFMSSAMRGIPLEKKSTAMGFFQAVYGVGMTFGPMLAGLLLTQWGMIPAYFSLAGLCVAGLFIVLLPRASKE